MRVLLLGAAGQVGRAVAAAHPPQHQLVSLDRSTLDIRDAAAVHDALAGGNFDWVVNAAAYTAVDAAEDDPQGAASVNADAVRVIAGAAQRHGVRLLHLSTDFVFDGHSSKAYEPDAIPNPLSVYGKTKLDGERAALGEAGNLVLRTSWVYAAAGRNFVLTMLKLMRERDSIRVVRDQIGSPTWAGGLGEAIWSMLAAGESGGVIHFCDDGIASWYDFAAAIQEESMAAGLLGRKIPIEPIRSEEYPTRAKRPAFSVLDTASTKRAYGLPVRHWRESLRRMLQELVERP